MTLLALAGASLLVLAFVASSGRPTGGGLVYAAALLGFGSLGLLLMGLSVKNGRLLVGVNAIGRRDVFGRSRIWTAAEVGTVVDATVLIGRKGQTRRYIFFLGLDGRRLLALNDITWSQSTIDRLVQASGKVVQVRAGPQSPAELRREFPGTFGPLTAHPYVFVGALFLVVVAVAFVVSFGPGAGR